MQPDSAITRHYALNNLKHREINTPDLKDLEMYDKHFLFVWDSAKYGFHGHFAISNSDYLGKAISVEDDFIMLRKQSTPFLYQDFVGQTSVQHSRVRGELYAISTQGLIRLDAIMQNNEEYMREKKYISCLEQDSPFKEGKKVPPSVSAWVYIAMPNLWDNVKKSGAYQCPRMQAGEDKRWGWEWLEKRTLN